ncbi:MAG: multicopper oxidase domain-containing protein [Bryobacteraceae bacterium]|nr:multicopper oxidase domain-containing protein [Bryobacteraceae bacterium]
MKNRRDFLKAGLTAAAYLSLSDLVRAQGPPPGTPNLTWFKDPLPLPGVIRPTGKERMSPKGYGGPPVDVWTYEVPIRETTHQFHADLPATRLWGYNGMIPGPSFEVRSGEPIQVRFPNELTSEQHLLSYAIDPTLHGAQPGMPEVRTVVHLHGGKVLPDSDGHPEAWYTRQTKQRGKSFTDDLYYYPNDQPATALWYHDHTIGVTRLNVLAGLAGLYTIRDADEDALNIPKGRFEVPLVLQDRVLRPDGSISYPPVGLTTEHPVWQPDYFTDTPVVNGKVRPFLAVEPRKYRFRITNGSNSRYFNIRLEVEGTTSQAAKIVQIGADQGFLPAPVPLDTLLIAPGQRADVIVDFSALQGKNVLITTDAKTPYGLPFDLPFPIPPPPSPMMQFRVANSVSSADTTAIPQVLPARPPIDASKATLTRDIVMVERTNTIGSPTILLLENRMYDEPVGVMPKAGSTEIWRFINAVIGGHPQHVHLAHMQVIDRQAFNEPAWTATGNIVPLGPPVPPAPNELNAPLDTVHVGFSEVVRVLVKFDLPENAQVTPNQRFRYVHHCHILEHEDNEMMRPFDVIG